MCLIEYPLHRMFLSRNKKTISTFWLKKNTPYLELCRLTEKEIETNLTLTDAKVHDMLHSCLCLHFALAF